MPEPSAKARFVEAMQSLVALFKSAPLFESQLLTARTAVEAFADANAECANVIEWHGPLQKLVGAEHAGHAACRAALLKEVFGG